MQGMGTAGVLVLPHGALPSPPRKQRLDGEDATLGKAAFPVIALESLGILPHKINAGAIKANLFHTHKTMLGNWPRHG